MRNRFILSIVLFTSVALIAFAIWAIGTRLYTTELGLYSLCAVIFLTLGGSAFLPLLRISQRRTAFIFCLRFAAGFLIYAALWSTLWFFLHNTAAEIFGSFFGLLGLALILKPTHPWRPSLLSGFPLLFLFHTLGYYTGDLAHQSLLGHGPLSLSLSFSQATVVTLARFSWGLFYGLGLGTGLAFYLAPSRPR